MERLIELGQRPSIISELLSEMRDENRQLDRYRFRENLETIGLLMGYEISKAMSYSAAKVSTPLAIADTVKLDDSVVICAILRAALPLQNGMAKAFRKADLAFISAYRSPLRNHDFEIVTGYSAGPNLKDKTLVLVDPMLATGRSALACYKNLTSKQKPKSTYFASVFSSQEGVAFLSKALPQIVHYTCAVDKELNSKSYIVPGLGDAGDLAFGVKIIE